MTSFNLCPCFCNFLYYKLSSCCKISKMTALKYIYDDACNRVYLFLLPFFISKYFSCCKLTELQYLINIFLFIHAVCSAKRETLFSRLRKNETEECGRRGWPPGAVQVSATGGGGGAADPPAPPCPPLGGQGRHDTGGQP